MGHHNKLIRLVEVVLQALIFIILMVSLHEHAHALIIHLLGGKAHVIFTFLSGHTIVTQIPTYIHWRTLVAAAGGLTVAVTFKLLDDMITEVDTSIALRLVIGHQLPYALLEGLDVKHTLAYIIAIAVGMILACIVSLPLFKKLIE